MKDLTVYMNITGISCGTHAPQVFHSTYHRERLGCHDLGEMERKWLWGARGRSQLNYTPASFNISETQTLFVQFSPSQNMKRASLQSLLKGDLCLDLAMSKNNLSCFCTLL